MVPKSKSADQESCSAVYIGSIIPSKGLHRLLRLWPKVKRACPEAKLHVIGSGALYDKKASLGPLGIADSRYEKKLLSYLGNKPVEHGVIFHGLLGHEKFEVMEKCVVGIPNPTALTECCPGSVLECASLGLPVVGRRKFGMVDTVVNDKTGFLVDGDKEFVERVVYLFSTSLEASIMGAEGVKFVSDTFSPEIITKKWLSLFKSIDRPLDSGRPIYIKGRYSYKKFVTINRNGVYPFWGLIRDFCVKVENAYSKLF
nr:glycosyltransferase family 4 protein [Microbulbifer sp. CAU 1566]